MSSKFVEDFSILNIKGPIDDDKLLIIAQLYGEYDKRLSDIENCKLKFNNNPFKYSLHTFVYYKDKIIAHCGVIPLEIFNGKNKELSGKLEALVVHKDYRKSFIKYNNKEIPIIIAVIKSLNLFSSKEGIDLLHALNNNKLLGVIYRMSGYKKLSIYENLSLFILNSKKLSILTDKKLKIFAMKIINFYQIFNFIFIEKLFSLKKFNLNNNNKKVFENFQNNFSPIKNKWTVYKNKELLEWDCDSEKVKIINIKDSFNNYLVFWESTKPENSIWIIDWNIDYKISYIKIFIYLIKYAKKNKYSVVVFPHSTFKNNEKFSKKIKKVLFFFSFVKIKQNIDIYVRSEDKFFHNVKNIDFNSFFYSV